MQNIIIQLCKHTTRAMTNMTIEVLEMESSGTRLIKDLLIMSEKAASIARLCRKEKDLLDLLIEEKEWKSTKHRNLRDFKTLADVLIQEMIRSQLEFKYPAMIGNIFGEETNEFTNTDGESITFNLTDDKENTKNLLNRVLEGYEEAVELLVNEIHTEINIDKVPVFKLPENVPDIDFHDTGIWIDPIDGTNEYIKGGYGYGTTSGISHIGLECVCVLIGTFSKSTGISNMGILNQPFYLEETKSEGRSFWGYSIGDKKDSSVVPTLNDDHRKLKLVMSMCENDDVINKLEKAGYEIITAAGAGYKCLCVILGLVDAYLLNFGSTFHWDTCGPHGLIKGLGGNIWSTNQCLKSDELVELKYLSKSIQSNSVHLYLNSDGILVSRDESLTKKIIDSLR